MIYNSSRIAQRIRATAAVAEEKRSTLFGVVGFQNPPPVSLALREEDSDPESNTRNCRTAQCIRVAAVAEEKRASFGVISV